jgi:two-component system sensor histidine kinase AgrC
VFETIIAFSRYFTALAFGIAVAVCFAGMLSTKKNYIVLGCYTVTVFAIQVICLNRFGMDTTWKLYPLLTHLPIAVFTAFYLKRSWLISLTSMFASFLCCQPPRWIGSLAGDIYRSMSLGTLKSETINHLGYIISVFIMYFVLKKYVAKSVQHLMERSAKSCLIFGAMPAFYYLFDHATTVYTDFLYSGSRTAVQFMPFVISAFYFVFILFYYAETQKQANIQRERDMLDTQLKQAQIELESLWQMQQNAAAYRHDMRHHFALLQSLALEGHLDEIKEYLRTAQSDMDDITPIRFSENETVNLILSAFAARATQEEIQFEVEAKLAELLPLSDTELCSLLSNALENAINAASSVSDSDNRSIKLRLYSKNKKLCIDVRNSFNVEPEFYQGLPISNKQGHGYGTKSMARIVEKHGGVYQFLVKDGYFIFQATT